MSASPRIADHAVVSVVAGSGGEGRFVRARVPVAAGAAVLRTDVYAHGVGEAFRRLACHRCLRSSPRRWTLCCAACREVFYCSDACRDADADAGRGRGFHTSAGECAALAALAQIQARARKAPPTSPHVEYRETWDQVRLCIMIASRYAWEQQQQQQQQQQDGVVRSCFEDVLAMMDRRELLTPRHVAAANYIVDTAIECLSDRRGRRRARAGVRAPPVIARALLYEAFLRVRCNSFNVLDDEWDPIGVAMCPLASYFNHSCEANAQFLYETDHVVVVATKPIQAGEEISLCYTGEDMCRELRQDYLRQHYYFDCACARCVAEAALPQPPQPPSPPQPPQPVAMRRGRGAHAASDSDSDSDSDDDLPLYPFMGVADDAL